MHCILLPGFPWTDFDEILYLRIFENLSREFEFYWKPSRITGTLREDVFTFMTTSRWILLRMRSVSNKFCRENKNTRFAFSNFFFGESDRLWDSPKKATKCSDYCTISLIAHTAKILAKILLFGILLLDKLIRIFYLFFVLFCIAVVLASWCYCICAVSVVH